MILAKATETLGSRDISTQWFNKPSRGLNYRSPCNVVTDDQGLQQVLDYLARIEFGVYC
ncbi:antitoxin Xre/MbcA/ParS toxin-binding domain-containing protein [Pseudomonas sp. COR18]|uniref:antitoxin Xre/MbcA/ParS toxin-binding domain-containing protein n=1 Tax=Pseudomonas sp. COR18 TaxID=3399680 RepID=UPI003AFFDA0D